MANCVLRMFNCFNYQQAGNFSGPYSLHSVDRKDNHVILKCVAQNCPQLSILHCYRVKVLTVFCLP